MGESELTFGQKLAKLRKKRNLNKVDLSRLVGVTDVYIGRIESGSKVPPKFEITKKIQKALHLTSDDSFILFKKAFEERTLKEKKYLDELKKIKDKVRRESPLFDRGEDLMEKFGKIYNRARMNSKIGPKLSEIADILNDADQDEIVVMIEIMKGIRSSNKPKSSQANRNSKVSSSI